MKRLIPFVCLMAIAPTAFAGIKYSYSPSSGSATPGGADTNVQYNDGGALGGEAELAYDETNDRLNLTKAGIGVRLLANNSTNGSGVALGAGSSFSYVQFDDNKDFMIASQVDPTVSPTSGESLIYVVGGGTDRVGVGRGNAGPVTTLDVLGDISSTNNGTAAGLRLYEPSGSGSNYSRFIAQAQAADLTYTLPNAHSSGVLTNNGSGTLTWATSSGSNWTDSGTYLQPNTAGDEMQVFGSTTGFINIGMATNQPEITYNWTGNSTTVRLYNTEYSDTKLKLGNTSVSANDYMMIGSDSDVPFIAAPGTGYTTGIGFISNAMLPINHTGSEALGGLSYSDDGESLGSSSYRWQVLWLSDELNIGTDLGGRLNIDGQADERQLWIQGHATQTNPIVLVEKSDGTDLFKINNAGATTSEVQIVVFDFATNTATGDGKFYFHIGKKIGASNLVHVHAEVITAGTTGTTDIQIHNVDNALDMLTTKLTIDSTETGSDTAATAAVINTSNDDVDENDVIRIDVDAVSTTPAVGLIVTLGFDPR
jgi:hypothetical protein